MRINQKQKNSLKEVALNFQLKLIILFGSYASGDNRLDSDLDIAVLANKSLSFKQELKLIGKISQIFGKNVDLSLINKANPLLLNEISSKGILLYGTKNNFISFQLYAFHKYNDYAPFFKMEAEFVKRQIRAL